MGRLLNHAGLTLLEVLVALVILAIALTAVIKSTSQNIRSTGYLQEKTIATWVGLDVINSARLGLVKFPESPEHRDGNELMLDQSWEWEGLEKSSANASVREIHVKVFHQPDHRLVTEMVSYAYKTS